MDNSENTAENNTFTTGLFSDPPKVNQGEERITKLPTQSNMFPRQTGSDSLTEEEAQLA